MWSEQNLSSVVRPRQLTGEDERWHPHWPMMCTYLCMCVYMCVYRILALVQQQSIVVAAASRLTLDAQPGLEPAATVHRQGAVISCPQENNSSQRSKQKEEKKKLLKKKNDKKD